MKQRAPATDPPAEASSRHAAWLDRHAAEAGQRWAERCRKGLTQQGRPHTGGWPGTLSEARAVAAACLAEARDTGRPPTLSNSEMESFARQVNACARRDWLTFARDEAPEPPLEDADWVDTAGVDRLASQPTGRGRRRA